MNVQEIITGLAAAAQAMANSSSDPALKVSASSAAVLIALVGRVLEGRTPDEAKEVLEELLRTGVRPISALDLENQARKIINDLNSKA